MPHPTPTPAQVLTIRVRLWREGNEWSAMLDGKSSPILRPVPGNTHPACAAMWATADAAVAELPSLLGHPVEIVRCPICADPIHGNARDCFALGWAGRLALAATETP